MPLTYADAIRLIEAAHAQAADLGIAVTVAVVDAGGHLVALGRQDGAPPLSVRIAEAKACGSALWHREGGQLKEFQESRPAFWNEVQKLVSMPIIPGLGSILIRRDGTVLGAVGVSGGAPDQDHACAAAGLRALIAP